MKVVVNRCYGGFSISREAAEHMAAAGSKQAAAELAEKGKFCGYGYVLGLNGYDRTDPLLIAAVEALGKKANGYAADLKIVEVPDEVEWTIEEYDGQEWVAKKHRTW